jgi:enoyl-CoA hydratase
MSDEIVITRTEGPVLVVTINRPDRRNAIDNATAHRLEAAWDLLDRDDALRVGVLTGAGDFFSAGADLKAAAAGLTPARTERRGQFGTVALRPEKPLIAAVEGDALGGGCELALASDLIVASRASRFGLPECSRGVVAAAGGLIRLPRRLPPNIAMEMALTGLPQPAERLFALGLVNHICEPGGALAAALALASTIAANAPLAVVASKRVINGALECSEAEAWSLLKREWEEVRESADYREGIAAFAEKRAPCWRGK